MFVDILPSSASIAVGMIAAAAFLLAMILRSWGR
jgi:hypothetical protein